MYLRVNMVDNYTSTFANIGPNSKVNNYSFSITVFLSGVQPISEDLLLNPPVFFYLHCKFALKIHRIKCTRNFYKRTVCTFIVELWSSQITMKIHGTCFLDVYYDHTCKLLQQSYDQSFYEGWTVTKKSALAFLV